MAFGLRTWRTSGFPPATYTRQNACWAPFLVMLQGKSAQGIPPPPPLHSESMAWLPPGALLWPPSPTLALSQPPSIIICGQVKCARNSCCTRPISEGACGGGGGGLGKMNEEGPVRNCAAARPSLAPSRGGRRRRKADLGLSPPHPPPPPPLASSALARLCKSLSCPASAGLSLPLSFCLVSPPAPLSILQH